MRPQPAAEAKNETCGIRSYAAEVTQRNGSLVTLDETIPDRYNNKVNDDGDVSKWP